MTSLTVVAIGLCVGWAILWISLGRQVHGQAELMKKIEALERQK